MTTKPRVSCTCSICRDGENKAVYTAKDGEKGDYMFIMHKGVENYTPGVQLCVHISDRVPGNAVCLSLVVMW